jgi:two-component system osmolarity sensor histidine kinase EnvZ
LLEIRVQLDNTVMRVFARRSAAYVSNSEIFLLWMVGTSTVLLIVAIIFLRNQIKPILRLADAAESFGKGREVPNFRPRGAREVRRAAAAFIEMKTRIERAIEQRTAMLAASRMTCARCSRDSSSSSRLSKRKRLKSRRCKKTSTKWHGCWKPILPSRAVTVAKRRRRPTWRNFWRNCVSTQSGMATSPPCFSTVRRSSRCVPAAFKRCLANLVSNAARHAPSIAISGHRDHRYLTVTVDDDGPGIPSDMREEVFKPFLRLDDARNQDEGGTGLGLAIARDIARSHGGDITLGDSPMGGLRATVRVPV